jgi:hypothetical protein
MAQAMTLEPAFQEIPTSRALLATFQEIFHKLKGMASHNTPLAQMLPRLQSLPAELQEIIFSFVLNHPGGYVLFNSRALDVLDELRLRPEEGHITVSCQGALFARWGTFKEASYLAGLYAKKPKGTTTRIKAEGEDWDYIVVRSDDIGVIDVTFLTSDSASSLASGPGSVEVFRRPELTYAELWITLQVSPTAKRRLNLTLAGPICLPN